MATQEAKKTLTPDEQKLIDKFIEQYNQQQKDQLLKPAPGKEPRTMAKMIFDDINELPKTLLEGAKKHGPTVGKALNVLFGSPFTGAPLIPPGVELSADNKTQEFPPLPEESGSLGQTEVRGSEPEFEDSGITDQTKSYAQLIQELEFGASQMNKGIDVASAAANETQEQLTGLYNKLVPIEPITPFRVLGDLVKIGGAFAIGRNPGLALALQGAGDAIKNYDPAFRDYTARKNFANELLGGMTTIELKELDSKLAEGPEKRRLKTQVKLAELEGQRTTDIAKMREVSEDIRSRRASETARETAGLKVGRENLIDQIIGLKDTVGLVKIELARLNDDDDFDDLTQREKVTEALRNVINQRFQGQNISPVALKRAADDIYKDLARQIKK